MNNYIKGIALALISAIAYSIMPIFAVNVYKYEISTFNLLLIRFSISAIVLLVYTIIKYKIPKLNKKDLIIFIILGSVLYTMQAIFHFLSVKYISPSLAILILFTYPLFVCVISAIMNRESISPKTIASIIISFLGLILVLNNKLETIDMHGVLLSIGAALAYSVYTVIGAIAVKNQKPIITTTYVTLFAALSIFLITIINGEFTFNYNEEAIPYIFGIIFVCTIIADFCFFKSLELIGSTNVATLGMIEPLSTSIFSFLLLKEVLKTIQYIGILITIFGCISIVYKNTKKGDVVSEHKL
ncbi:DMT family transporter [Anaeromicropila populeti]|uniref:Threonine/homoserine efflux transporter RhtA n=1 Tax=Anaeromicropila populeti TaxID=37658 RepID=A0A1I6IWE3_9FIRM|nr:DMT family transporter [Anaeromicropila populeti]SFR71001.1 Threonine/homoserine efflux transporter RhtA [Anaeromicropila populeti]